ncbi:hypothetical protein Back2_19870 [Nocardioides baekrokdamisoli]|uniref:Type II secretion system protein GspF domain-containing protein n=1 Tax=Nocardioides baekrokdamisoli TaxID=1804624 RepID=A0A3G9IF96_9ACTN|nr:type II secretion system F family protein [Nocardioides baekrokdamisoli]BBH17700.1 hypothetical protein Back2_19870 [Nocardioides baekrokdamisoli]
MTVLPAALAAGSAVALLLPGGPGPVSRGWLIALLPMALFVPGPLVGAACVLGASAIGAYALLERRRRRAAADAQAAQVRDHCDQLAADLAAGAPTRLALTRLADRWPEVRRVVEADRFGLDVAAAWHSLAAETRLDSLRWVALAWSYAQQTGVGLAVAMRHVADGLAAQARVDRTVAAELASARATAWLVALLPIGVLAMGSGLGGNPWRFLLLTTPGVCLLGAGLALIWAGLWWLESIIEGVRR